MAKDRKTKTTPDGRHLLVVGLPVGIVLAVLIVGAVLQSGPSPKTDQPLAQAEELPLPPPPAYESRQPTDSALEENQLEADIGLEPADSPPVRPADSVSRLARRVMEDVDRLESSGDDWTAQIGVYCDDQRVTDLVQAHGKNPKLYVLPVLLDERACFRVCWGHYRTHDGAAGSRDLPAEFRGEKPLPRRVSTVTG